MFQTHIIHAHWNITTIEIQQYTYIATDTSGCAIGLHVPLMKIILLLQYEMS